MTARPALAALLVLVGCATSEQQSTPAAADNSGNSSNGDVVCQREYPVGSNIPVTKCRTVAQQGEDKRAADTTLEAVRRPGNVTRPTTQ